MLESDLYVELKSWQTSIGAAFGFIALIFGALFNFHLNRRRDTALKKDEIRAVAAALYGEILLLREEVAILARAVANTYSSDGSRKFNEQFVTDFKPREALLYPKLADKFGILPPELVLAITRFHGDYQRACNGLALMVDKDRGFTFSVLSVLSPALSAATAIRPALRQIELLTGINKASSDPDLGRAEVIAEMERQNWDEQSLDN